MAPLEPVSLNAGESPRGGRRESFEDAPDQVWEDLIQLCDESRNLFVDDGATTLHPGSDDHDDIGKLYDCRSKIASHRKRVHEVADKTRDDLRAIARLHQQHKQATVRPATIPSYEAHQQKVQAADHARWTAAKAINDLESDISRAERACIERRRELKDELKDDAFESELGSSVMVIQMFRDLGLTPGYGENGDIDKLLVRSAASKTAHSLRFTDESRFAYANRLWDALDS